MRTLVRSIAVLAVSAGLVGACAAAAAPTTAPTSTPAPAAVTVTPAPPDPTAAPTAAPTPAASVGPMDPAYVTGTGSIVTTVSEPTQRQVGELTYWDDVVLDTAGALSDPRLSGNSTLHLSAVTDHAGVGFEWGTARIENAGGAWEGTLRGAVWNDLNASDLSGWYVGSGDYEGLTYYEHIRSSGLGAEVVGVILPAEPPTP